MNRKNAIVGTSPAEVSVKERGALGLKALYVWHGTDTTRRHGAGNGAAGKPVTAKRVKV